MNIFDVVNELSVFGVTLFMMAVNTIWFSTILFGPIWLKATVSTLDEASISQKDMAQTALLTFVSYFVALMLIAYGVAVAPLLDVSLRTFALCAWMFAGSTILATAILEQRTLGYYVVTVGFMGLFTVGGSYMLLFWPW